jgi:hypothetical protein
MMIVYQLDQSDQIDVYMSQHLVEAHTANKSCKEHYHHPNPQFTMEAQFTCQIADIPFTSANFQTHPLCVGVLVPESQLGHH